MTKLQARAAQGRLRAPAKIHEALGRLKERYARVARYYALAYDEATRTVSWTSQAVLHTRAEHLDGTYLLRTDRQDLSDEEIWHPYMLLTRVEAASRAMKSPLTERLIFHHLEQRVQIHSFLCVLAYRRSSTLAKSRPPTLGRSDGATWCFRIAGMRTHPNAARCARTFASGPAVS